MKNKRPINYFTFDSPPFIKITMTPTKQDGNEISHTTYVEGGPASLLTSITIYLACWMDVRNAKIIVSTVADEI